ncbi:MAG: GmrSD restriction endonuclease domain-containing protein, partial [Corynebacterium sp.]|uniref:GmrSD restriction endonuclease domain-containing protein n=1 Tax=Corynebacterium sp. TaxID=1720 RepID=UPI003F945F07
DEFGQRWKDIDRNGCDQRNDVLARDLTGVGREGPCKVMNGTLADPYTATTINFVRGQDTSSAVQIDHVVAMSDAWQKGAQQLPPERREEFANDHLNLLAVDGPANMQKGDGDAATWLPANTGYRCSYVARQVEVKGKYGLWVTAAERDAIARILGDCGAGGLDPVVEAPAPAPAPAPVPEPAPAPAPAVPADPAGGGVYFQNCTAARDAGAAPLYRGAPGYRAQMDRDGDGVACE